MALKKVSFNPEAMMCDIDHKQCDTIHKLSHKLDYYLNGKSYDKSKLVNTVAEYLPCWYCKKTIEKEVSDLSNVRLGKHERRILLLAPSPESDSEIIEPGEPGLRAYESHLRAIRKLEKFGFLWKSRKKRRRVAVRLSPFGYAITKRLTKELQKRNPIRWAKFKEDLIIEASLSSDELLAKFENKIRYDTLLEALNGDVGSDSFISALADFVVRISKDGILIDFKSAKDWTPSKSPDEYIGKKMQELIPDEIAKLTMKHIQLVLRNSNLESFECQLPYQDETRDYEARMIKNHEDDVLIFVRDISEKKRSEEKLIKYTNTLEQYTADLILGNFELRRTEELTHKRELLLKSFLNNPIDPVFLINNEGYVLAINQIASQFVNKNEKDAVNTSIHELFQPNVVNGLRIHINDVIQKGKFAYFEETCNNKQYVFSVIPVFDAYGEVSRATIFLREMTEKDQIKKSMKEKEVIPG